MSSGYIHHFTLPPGGDPATVSGKALAAGCAPTSFKTTRFCRSPRPPRTRPVSANRSRSRSRAINANWRERSNERRLRNPSCFHGICTALLALLFSSPAFAQLEKTEQLGPVIAKVRLEPERPLIGDAVTLRISVLAEKDVELLMPEFGEALDRFTILDFVPKNEILDSGQTESTQTYRLQPPMSGKQSIPPILIEFVDRRAGQRQAPEGMDAYEILTPRIDFEVQSVVPQNASTELKPPLGELQPLGMTPTQRVSWAVGVVLLALLAATPFILKWWNARSRRVRRQSAYQIARTRLDRLTQRAVPQGEAIDGYFVELSSIVRQYLEDRFDLRAPELTTEEFLETVSDSGELTSAHQTLLQKFLKQADLVKFAGLQPNPSEIQRAVGLAEEFLEDTRENAPLVEVADHEQRETPDSAANSSVSDEEATHV